MHFFILRKDVFALSYTKLTVKQEAFCLHYAKTGNATESYKKAGYKITSDEVTGVNASRLLKNDKIQARLQELADEVHSSAIADITEIQETLTAILRNQAKEQVVVIENFKPKTIDKDTSIKDRLEAGKTLAKMQGGFDNTFKVELTVPKFKGEDALED